MLSHHLEVKMQQDSKRDGQYQYVRKISDTETEPIENKLTQKLADQGPALDVIYPYGKRPVRAPIPGQHNAGADKQADHQ
jgi:hypothetical protein